MNIYSTLLLFTLLIFPLNRAFTYLFTGLSIKVDTFTETPINDSIIFIELCRGRLNDLKYCLEKKEQINCKKNQGELFSGVTFQWDCLTTENYPFRLGIKQSGKLLYASDSFTNAVNSTSDRYALYLKNNKIEPIYLPVDRIFYIGLQEELENVFHPSVVQKIRDSNKTIGRKSWQNIEKPETSFVLKVCQNENCQKGNNQKIYCSFTTIGIRGLSYECRGIPGFARYAEVTITGRDKIRKTEFFQLAQKPNSGYFLNYIFIKSNSLELGTGNPPRM